MRLSVITAVKDNLAELEGTLDSVVRALAHATSLAAPVNIQVQLLVVAPEGGAHHEAQLVALCAATSARLQPQADDGGGLDIARVVDPGTGIAAAFNCGLRECSGNWITVLNAGDLWFEETLAAFERAALARPDAVLHSAITYEDERGERYQVPADPARMHLRMTLFHPTLFVPAAVYSSVGVYDETYRLAMDSHWCHRALTLGVSFHNAGHSLAIMRLGGVSDQGYAQALEEFRRSVVATGLLSPARARFHCERIKLAKRLTHLPLVRRLRVWWRGFAQSSGQS